MRISKETFEVLNNYALVNNGLVVDEEKSIKTMSPTGSIISVYDTEEEFPVFAIWDVSKFNSIVSVMGIEECEFTFEDNQGDYGSITLKSGSRKSNYGYADAGSMPVFEQMKNAKDYKAFDKFDFTFELLAEDIKEIKKVNSIFGFSEDVLKVSMEDGVGTLRIFSEANETKDDYIIEIDGEGTGECLTKVGDLIMISDDYTASVNSQMVRYQSKSKPLLYFIRTHLQDR